MISGGSVSAISRMPDRMSLTAVENVFDENPRLRSCSVRGYTPLNPPWALAASGVSTSGCTMLQRPLKFDGLPNRMYSVAV